MENEIVPAFSQKVKQIDYIFGLATFSYKRTKSEAGFDNRSDGVFCVAACVCYRFHLPKIFCAFFYAFVSNEY